MAWEWSHTAEAMDHALTEAENLPRRELLTIVREWACYDREKRAERDPGYRFPRTVRGQFRLPAGVRQLHQDTLADIVKGRMVDYATCDNGGHHAWCCPYGCHTVSFGGE